MLLSAIDPALLIYRSEDWRTGDRECARRFEALILHRGISAKYDQQMVMSTGYAGVVCQSFPWRDQDRGIGDLRDLRRLVMEILQRARYLEPTADRQVSVQPAGILCEYVEAADVVQAFEGLLSACLDDSVVPECHPQVATWERDSVCSATPALRCTIYDCEEEDGRQSWLPLVWDCQSWASRLSTQEWWPDLERCVELCFMTSPAMRGHPGATHQPVPFVCTPRFWSSVEAYSRDQRQRGRLIKAVTKRVYRIFDAGLSDEAFGKMRRFRVTGFWRVHYTDHGDHLVLEEFGRHDMATAGG